MPEYSKSRIEALVDGTIPWADAKEMMSSFKDPDRFDKYREIRQEKVSWDEPILLPLTDNLHVVSRDGERIVKCECGQEYGDHTENWKLDALIHVREDREELQEIYPEAMHSNPDWMILREYFCPGCKTQLEVEAVPPGYPVVFDFRPDIDAFYEEWLGQQVPE